MSKSLSRIEKKQGEKVGSHSKIPILLMVTVCLAYLTATCQVAIIRSEKQAGMRAGPVLVAARKPPNVISWPPKLQVVVRPSSGFHLFNLLLCVVQEFFFFFFFWLSLVCVFVCLCCGLYLFSECVYSVFITFTDWFIYLFAFTLSQNSLFISTSFSSLLLQNPPRPVPTTTSTALWRKHRVRAGDL